MAFSHLQLTKCVLQKIAFQQVMIVSVKVLPYASQFTSRNIMSTPTLLCNSSLNIPQIKMYDFEKHLKNKTVVIDVREPHELQQIGQIPDTFNIPLGEVDQAFQLPADVFERKYNFSKPAPDQSLVLTCRSGRRSNIACEILTKLGYDNVMNFSEGWLGWEEKLKQQQQQTQWS